MSENAAATAPASPIRRLLSGAGLLGVVITLALAGVGSTYALWNDKVPASGATVSTGTIGLTVNDVTSYTVAGLTSTPLLPGRSVVPAQPLTLKNTGIVPLSITSTGTTFSAASSVLQPWLQFSLRTTTATSCTVTADSVALPATIAPISLGVGQSVKVCLEVRLSAAAPATVQGASADFTIGLSGAQVRP